PTERPFRLADRVLFQLLSRIEPDDPDRVVAQRAQELLVEFHRAAKNDPGLGRYARRLGREAAACALARGGHIDDPRVRGTAHTIASNISQYLRSELAAKPFKKAHGKTVLEPAAYPPTVFATEMLAFLPPVQRVRRVGDLEPAEPTGHAQSDESCHGPLLPARGTREEPGAAADGRDVPAGVDCATDGNPDRGGVTGAP